MKIFKIVINFLVDNIIGKIITTIIPSLFFYFGLFRKFDFNNFYFNKMEIGLTIIFGLIIWSVLTINTKLKRIRIRQKYYNIMLTKFHDKYKGHLCTVFPDDISLFSKDEQKYLQEYLEEQEKMRIIMKGKNKTIGMF